MQGRPAPPQPYIMLTVATSLTACTKWPSSCGQQPGHQLGALGGRGDGVAEEVAAAGQQRADGRGVGPLQDERLPLRQRQPHGGDVEPAGPEPGRRVGSSAPAAVGLGAGVDAEAAAVALVELERDRHQPGQRVDLLAGHDAAVRRRRRRIGCSPCSTPVRVPASDASRRLTIDDLLARPGRPRPPRKTEGFWHRTSPMASAQLADLAFLRCGGGAVSGAWPGRMGHARADAGPGSSGQPTAAWRGQSSMRTQPRRSSASGYRVPRQTTPPRQQRRRGAAEQHARQQRGGQRQRQPLQAAAARQPTGRATVDDHARPAGRRSPAPPRATGRRPAPPAPPAAGPVRPAPAPATASDRQPGPVLGPGEGVLHQAEHRGPEAVLPAHRDQRRRRRPPPAPRRCGAAPGRASRRPPPRAATARGRRSAPSRRGAPG